MTSAALSVRIVRSNRIVIRDCVAEHRVLLGIFAVQIVVCGLMCAASHRPLFIGLGDAFVTIDGAVVIFGVMAFVVALVRARPRELPLRSGYRAAGRAVRGRVLSTPWLASVAIMLIVLPVSLAVFSAAKRAIPSIEPFAWDRTLERLGREVHGGRHAWEWLQPIVGRPIITVVLDRYYHVGWSLLVLGTVGLVVVSPVSRLRRQFLTAWVALSLVCGTIMALTFSSAGPPYFGRVTGQPDPYSGLRSYLRGVNASVPLLSVGGRRVLWAAYQSHVDSFGLGISAMPSMHIATIALVTCLAWAVSPMLGTAAAAATVLMLVGSVSLCWHYAIDGYAGVLLAVAIWCAVGMAEGRYRRGSQGQNTTSERAS